MIYLLFLRSLLITLFVECGLVFCFYGRKKYLYPVFLCNLLTNLLLLLEINLLGTALYYPLLAILEVIVVLAEGWLLCRLCHFKAKRGLGLSLVLNLSSFGAGLLISFWEGSL